MVDNINSSIFTLSNNKKTNIMTYLRFTNTIKEDLEKGFSYLKTPSMKKTVKLNGLCAFSFDTCIDNRDMTEDEIISKIKRIANNQYYLNTDTAVLIEGDYIGNNPNGEGVIIKANYILNTYSL